jgi:PKD repeat protein
MIHKADVIMHSTLVNSHSPSVAARLARRAWLPLLAAAIGAAGCTHKADTPPGTGPSVQGLSIELAASPDVLDLDGLSQSQITITARGPDSTPLGNIGLNLDLVAGGGGGAQQIVDIGRLSSKTATTGSDGRATVTYTAPSTPIQGNSDSLPTITIMAVPASTDYSNMLPRSVEIRLRPRGVILPVAGTPFPKIFTSPTDPGEDQDVRFDASLSIPSCVEGTITADGCVNSGTASIVSYLWDFGNGRTGSGARTSSFFSTAGTYTVKLTVTNDRGFSNSTSQSISIKAVASATADFTASPQTVGVGERVNVDASASKPTGDRFLIEYNWTWGDGGRSSGLLSSHSYSQAGSYSITLTVVDSSGRTATATKTVTVGTGLLPTANFSFSPTAPVPNDVVNFDATLSVAPPGRTIRNYEWNFGDGSAVLSGPNEARPQHRFGQAGTFIVTLTVTDSNNAKSTAVTKTIPVAVP